MKIGLYIIGDEILSGRRQDKHLTAIIELLRKRGLLLSWVQILGDDFDFLVKAFKTSLASDDLVFSTGGIGGTPDDLTRQAVAQAAGVAIEPHPEGIALLEEKFGAELTPLRKRMIEFPQQASLIPNPVNQIPGFSFQQHYCVPGFPQMAWPMLEWVLDKKYPHLKTESFVELAVRVVNTPESHLIPLMEMLLQRYPDLKVFSLPTMNDNERFVDLGVKGQAALAKEAMHLVKTELRALNATWEAL